MKPLCMTQEQWDLWKMDPPKGDYSPPCYDCNPEHQGKHIRKGTCSHPSYSDGPNFACNHENMVKVGKKREYNLSGHRNKYPPLELNGKRVHLFELASKCGVSKSTIHRAKAEGLTGDQIYEKFKNMG